MPLFLSEQTLRDAVTRLGISSSAASLGDFLVFKRALKIGRDIATEVGSPEPNSVVTGTLSPAFMQAHIDLGLRVPPHRVLRTFEDGNLVESMRSLVTGKRGNEAKRQDPSLKTPYFVPFGARRDNSLGYRQSKWPSNGPSDTVNRWQSRSSRPLVVIPDSSPKEYAFEARTERELSTFFNVDGTGND